MTDETALVAEEIVDEGDPRDRPPRDNLVRSMLTTEFRAVTDEEQDPGDGRLGTLFGRMATFGVWAEVNSQVEGHFMERVAPGAFTKTFKENRSRMQVIFDHGLDRAIGRKPLGPLEQILEDERTIDYQSALLDTSYNKDLLPALRAGLMGSSYRFDTIKDSWRRRPGKSEHNPQGLPERTVLEAKVIELGPTPFPVYAETSAGVRSLTDEYMAAIIGGTALPERAAPSVHPQEGSRDTAEAGPTFDPVSRDDFLHILRKGTW